MIEYDGSPIDGYSHLNYDKKFQEILDKLDRAELEILKKNQFHDIEEENQ